MDGAIDVLQARYGPIGDWTLLRRNQNAVFAATLRGRAVVFRVAPAGHRGGKETDAELAFLRYLDRRGDLVCAPVAALDGAYRVELAGGSIACCFARAAGRHPDIGDAADIEIFARGLARLHELSRGLGEILPRKNAVDDPFFAVEPAGPEAVELCDWLRGLARDPHRFGLVHGDYNTGNALIAGGALKIFDFDDCAYHWYEYEAANTLYMVLFALRGQEDLGEFYYFRDALLANLDAVAYRRDEIARFVHYRVLLLGHWLRRPEVGPMFIREMTPEWGDQLRAFIRWFAEHRRRVMA